MGDIGKLFTNIFSKKNGKSKLPIKIILLLLLTIITVSAIKDASETDIKIALPENKEELTSLLESNVSEDVLTGLIFLEEPVFAENIGGKSIFSEDASNYLELMNDFEDLSFKDISNQEMVFNQMNVGSMGSSIEGYLINNKKYVVHLIFCYKDLKACTFRINGVTTNWISSSSSDLNERTVKELKVNEDLSIKLDSIEFDYCGDQRFCDYYFEAYDRINITLDVHIRENNPKNIESSSEEAIL